MINSDIKENYKYSIKAVIKLIRRYETITLDEITNAFKDVKKPQTFLTGFGKKSTCTICRAININCRYCILNFETNLKFSGCVFNKPLYASYTKIKEANTPKKLHYAYNQRAIVLRDYLQQFDIQID